MWHRSTFSRAVRLNGRSCWSRRQRSFFSKNGWTAEKRETAMLESKEEKEKEQASARVLTYVDSSTGICHVQLNRPDKLNALDMKMFRAIRDAAQTVANDKSIRAVVLSGNGRAFCTGLDVPSLIRGEGRKAAEELLTREPPTAVANLAQQVAYAWRELPVPVICSLHGMCFGGGMQIALGADIRLATADCRLSIMEAKWGLIPDMSAAVTLRELVPMDVAKELTWTGRIVQGTEAARLGLVTRVVAEQEDPLDAAFTLAREMVQRSPDAIAAAKELYQSTWNASSTEYCLRVETALQERLLMSWNQLAASSRAFGWRLPYFQRKSRQVPPLPNIQDFEGKHHESS